MVTLSAAYSPGVHTTLKYFQRRWSDCVIIYLAVARNCGFRGGSPESTSLNRPSRAADRHTRTNLPATAFTTNIELAMTTASQTNAVLQLARNLRCAYLTKIAMIPLRTATMEVCSAHELIR